jgi:hypothetical protein
MPLTDTERQDGLRRVLNEPPYYWVSVREASMIATVLGLPGGAPQILEEVRQQLAQMPHSGQSRGVR